jgi:nitroreductase
MDILRAIYTRRSIGKVKQDPVDQDTIEKLLEAAVWAPNHYHTEPWRFFVLTGEGRRSLGRTLADIAQEKMIDPQTTDSQGALKKLEGKAFRAPVIIAAAAVRSDHPKVPWIEEMAAVHASVQNMLLAAHALGLGAIWRTGDVTYHPKMKKLFGLRDIDELVGFIYVGHPDIRPTEGKRVPFSEKTTWINQDIL